MIHIRMMYPPRLDGGLRKVRIERCSVSGAWYETLVGETVTSFAHDSYGYWTRDTGPMRLSQWIKTADATLLPLAN